MTKSNGKKDDKKKGICTVDNIEQMREIPWKWEL
jgi:hypothetical protein